MDTYLKCERCQKMALISVMLAKKSDSLRPFYKCNCEQAQLGVYVGNGMIWVASEGGFDRVKLVTRKLPEDEPNEKDDNFQFIYEDGDEKRKIWRSLEVEGEKKICLRLIKSSEVTRIYKLLIPNDPVKEFHEQKFAEDSDLSSLTLSLHFKPFIDLLMDIHVAILNDIFNVTPNNDVN